MLKNNYFGETKTHYKLYKCGKNWAVMGISLFSLGLGMLVTSRPVSADVAATSTSSSAVKADTTSASSSSAVKADATSASSSSAVKADVTSASSNATKADATSASSSSAVNADATSASSSSAVKADATSASSSSAVNADATSASSSSAVKADVTSASSNATKADATSASSSSAVNADTTSSAAKVGISNAKLAMDNSSSQTDTTGVTVTSSFNNGDTFSGGGGVIALNTSIEKSATISNGAKLTFTVSNPSSINWDNIQLNGGTTYGSLAYDKTSGTITYTFNTDISNAGINFIVNLHTAAADTSNNIITASLNNTSVAITGGTSFNTKASSGGSGSYNGQRLIIGNGDYGYTGIQDNYVGYISGKNYYLPDMQSMDFNVVVDPGFYTNSQNDKTGRTITLSISGTGASLQADNIYITEKGGYPNTSKSYVTLSSVGWTTTQVDDQTVKISIPDNMDIGWYVLGIVATTPNLNSQYVLTDKYESDYITTAQESWTSGYFQNINNSGFVPKITATDKDIKQGTTVSDITEWLLDGVTASDVEDGNLSSTVTIKDDTNFVNAWNNNKNGVYTIIYTVTDSDGNTVTQSVNATIYSDITVHYVDKNGTELSTPTTLVANSIGSSYNVIPTSLIKKNGVSYYYVSANSNLSGIYGESNQPTDIYLTYNIDQTSIDTKDSTLVAGPNTICECD
ncbi:KxYKxGKxW signal peptide domain-containing protein [Lactiplantibacillus plantarum]|uniref:KxYKxGKxW signal peptide domain-containing protein n=1 Tax=Lactiplantibacillus plantarum TaxID=1590 RepID=UPI001EDB2586|nr:KxYKxGKxW signal peptide domain-containing protein [Lactiplantibacillus plantarum]